MQEASLPCSLQESQIQAVQPSGTASACSLVTYLTSFATEVKLPASRSLPDFASFLTPRSIVSRVTPLYPALFAKSCSVSFSSTILFCLLALALLTSSSSSSSFAGISALAANATRCRQTARGSQYSVDQVVTHATFLHNERHGHRRKHSGHCSAPDVDVLWLLCLASHGLSAASNAEWLSLFVHVRREVADLRASDAALHHACYLNGGRRRMMRQGMLCECRVNAANGVVLLLQSANSGKCHPPRKTITPVTWASNCNAVRAIARAQTSSAAHRRRHCYVTALLMDSFLLETQLVQVLRRV